MKEKGTAEIPQCLESFDVDRFVSFSRDLLSMARDDILISPLNFGLKHVFNKA